MPMLDNPWLAGTKLVVAYMTVGLAPGLLAIHFMPYKKNTFFFQTIGLAGAVSLLIVQMFCVAALLFHFSINVTAITIVSILVLGGVAVNLYDRKTGNQTQDRERPSFLVKAGIASILITALLLYAEGGISTLISGTHSPSLGWEDTLHIGIAQRLATTPSPAIDNVFLYPDFVYTYPFPGIHYFYALVSCVGNFSDVIFVYDKGRFYWWLLSVSLCSELAYFLTGRRIVAETVPLVFSFFVITGALARMPGFYVGQVAPMSHAAVVAGDVLLPGALLAAITAIMYDDSRSTLAWPMTIAWGLSMMLILVHPRECVQLLVYLCSFALSLTTLRYKRFYVARALVLTMAILGSLVAYRFWHSEATPALSAVLAADRLEFETFISQMSWKTLIMPLGLYTYGINLTFYGLYGIMFVATPIIIWANRDRPGILMIGLSMIGFLLVSYVGWLSIPFIRLTSVEMLTVPVRNWWLFMRLLLVVLIIDLAVLLVRRLYGYGWREALTYFGTAGLIAPPSPNEKHDKSTSAPRLTPWALAEASIIICSVGALAYFLQTSSALLRNALLVLVIFLLLTACIAAIIASKTFSVANKDQMSSRYLSIAAAGIIAALAVATWMPMNGPLARVKDWLKMSSPEARTKLLYETELAGLKSDAARSGLTEEGACFVGDKKTIQSSYIGEAITLLAPKSCYPPYRLVEWMRKNLPPQSVLWVDLYGVFSPQPFVNVQLALLPLGKPMNLKYLHLQFPKAAEAVRNIRSRGGQQPILDGIENDCELLKRLREFRVTHVVVDPSHNSVTERFETVNFLNRLHRSDGWSIYEVN